jgi:hypothetical protein
MTNCHAVWARLTRSEIRIEEPGAAPQWRSLPFFRGLEELIVEA